MPAKICNIEATWLSEGKEFSNDLIQWQRYCSTPNMPQAPDTRCLLCATSFLLPLLQQVAAFFLPSISSSIFKIASQDDSNVLVYCLSYIHY